MRLEPWRIPSVAVVVLVLVPCSRSTWADGKLYGRDGAPLHEPHQRALIAHADGVELLMVQPKLEGAASAFGWVIPVPAPPELGALDAADARELFADLEDASLPEPRYCRQYALLGSWVLLTLPWWLLWRAVRQDERFLSALILAGWGASLVGASILVLRGGMRTDPTADGSEDGVEVLAHEELGIYDTYVLRSTEPGALQAWLREHRFRSGPEDEAVIRDYESRGWCFVAARVGSEELQRTGREALLDALVVRFPTRDIVYPFALTATQSRPTEVDIHVFADRRLRHGALQTTFAGRQPFGEYQPAAYVDDEEADQGQKRPPPRLEANPRYLTRLQGTLSRAASPGDLILEPAATNEDYRSTRWRW